MVMVPLNYFEARSYPVSTDPQTMAKVIPGWQLLGWRHAGAPRWAWIDGWSQAEVSMMRDERKLITTAQARIPGTSTFALYAQPINRG